MNICIFAILIFYYFPNATGYKFLGVFAYASKSHLNSFIPLANELAIRGHEVTIIKPYPELKTHPNIMILEPFDVLPLKTEESRKLFDKEESSSIYKLLQIFKDSTESACKQTLESDVVKKLLKAGKQFDVILVNDIFNECGFSIAHLLGNYSICFAAGHLPTYIYDQTPTPYATVPANSIPLPPQMNFAQRLLNVYTYIRDTLLYRYYILPGIDKVAAELVHNANLVWDAYANVSLYMINWDPATVMSKPTVPNTVVVSCAHCKDSKPLPEEMENYVASSGDDGFIIFGLGSHVQSIHFPEESKKAFLKAFARLKQNVIWKFEDDSLEVPPNVYITKWMPQNDLLGHPKIRLFITHGGLLSLQEAVYHGVPVIAIPVFADQPGNAAYMESKGLAGQLHLNNITTENVYNEIMKILDDPNYRVRLKQLSAILKDHSKDSVTKGANWIEYVAKHDGAFHLRADGHDMNIFQYYLINVLAVIFSLSVVIIYILYASIKFTLKKLNKSKFKKS